MFEEVEDDGWKSSGEVELPDDWKLEEVKGADDDGWKNDDWVNIVKVSGAYGSGQDAHQTTGHTGERSERSVGMRNRDGYQNSGQDSAGK